MGIYKNDYAQKEDELLWELHEIRHKLHQELKNKSVEDINNIALKKFKNWKSQKNSISTSNNN